MAWMKVPPWLFFLVLLGPQEGKGQSGEQEELDSKELMLVLGESVSLPVNIEEGEEIEKIIWSFHSTLAVIQQEAMKEPSISIVPDPRYNVIVNISDHTYSLHISNLSKEDEGTYRAEMNFEGFPGTITQKFILRVYRRLPKPKVTVILEISEESVCNVTLKCHVDGKGDEEEFSWTSLDPGAIVSDGGSVLHLSWRPGDSDWTSTCIVRNPVSFSSHSLPVEQFCTGNWLHCHLPRTPRKYPEQSSFRENGPPLPLVLFSQQHLLSSEDYFKLSWEKLSPPPHISHSAPTLTQISTLNHPVPFSHLMPRNRPPDASLSISQVSYLSGDLSSVLGILQFPSQWDSSLSLGSKFLGRESAEFREFPVKKYQLVWTERLWYGGMFLSPL
uniref:SLAM family member 9 n=1 Tax=Monodelphis domestica TaxID=13616 RepID=A0A5F8HEI5_MONDO